MGMCCMFFALLKLCGCCGNSGRESCSLVEENKQGKHGWKASHPMQIRNVPAFDRKAHENEEVNFIDNRRLKNENTASALNYAMKICSNDLDEKSEPISKGNIMDSPCPKMDYTINIELTPPKRNQNRIRKLINLRQK